MRGVFTCAALGCAVLGASISFASPRPADALTIRIRVFHFVDHSRSMRLPNGSRVPRPVETVVRYPSAGGPYPLVVFGHGFALRPATYAGLLTAWAKAGYVVAAPVFPLGNANAPGGATESDLVNQPGDVSFVVSRLLRLNTEAPLRGAIEPTRIAVAGHSDGAETALAVAYDRRYRDRRIRAAIILSGAPLPGMGPFPLGGPPLLAVQGTADPLNAPATTAAYFRLAHRPKFLLWLIGAAHLSPYTDERPQLDIVERTTIAFLAHYLGQRPLSALTVAALHPRLTRFVAEP
jgi:predicted dienelactone hydrolase